MANATVKPARLTVTTSGGTEPVPRAHRLVITLSDAQTHVRDQNLRFSNVTATDLAQIGELEAADSGFGHWVAARRVVLFLYFVSLGVWSAHYGIPVQRELVVAWVCGALVCASLGRPWREVLRLVRDWLPMMILLAAYDFTRGAADSLGIGVHVHV